MSTDAKPTPRDQRPIVTIAKPRCPRCHSQALKTIRSTVAADGSSTRDVRCRDPECGLWFFIIAE